MSKKVIEVDEVIASFQNWFYASDTCKDVKNIIEITGVFKEKVILKRSDGVYTCSDFLIKPFILQYFYDYMKENDDALLDTSKDFCKYLINNWILAIDLALEGDKSKADT